MKCVFIDSNKLDKHQKQFSKYGKITSKEKLPKPYSLGSFSGCLHKKTSETVKNTSKTVKHQQIRPTNLSGCCLHGVCTSGICFAETLLAEAGVEKTPSQWNGVLVSKRRSLVSKKGKNTSQTGKQFRKYFYCFCLAEALLAEAEVEKTPNLSHPVHLLLRVTLDFSHYFQF